MERLSLNAEYDRGVMVLAISGELDIYTLPKVKQATDLILEHGVKNLVFNLEQLHHMDSSAIGFLVNLNRRLKSDRGGLLISAISGEVSEVFRVTRSDKLFCIKPTVNEAVTSIISEIGNLSAPPAI